MPLGKDFKYKTRLVANIKNIEVAEPEKVKNIAMASIKELEAAFCNPELIAKIRQNPDLLFCASNLIIADEANLNDDAVRKEDLLKIYKSFQLKLLDVEHDRKVICGAIYDSGFSYLDTGEIISPLEAAMSKESIQLYVIFYLWRLVNPELADSIEENPDPASQSAISTSFELIFDEYEIGIGLNGNKDVRAARIIDASSNEFAAYDSVLRCNGGSGKTGKDGRDIVFRILKGDILPSGMGLVLAPGSGLRGILAVTEVNIEIPVEEAHPLSDVLDAKTQNKVLEILDDKNNNINNLDISVTSNITSIKHMHIKTIEDLDAKWSDIKKLETAASVKEFVKEHVEASARDLIADAIAKKSEEFAAQLKAKEELVAAVEANKVDIEAKASDLEKSVESLKKELAEIRSAQASALAEDKFNSHMAAFDEEFDLDDEDRQIIAQDLKAMEDGLDVDDAKFKGYFGKQKKLMKEKSKSVKKAKAEELAKTVVAGAKVTVDVKEVIASVIETEKQAITNGVSVTETLKQKYEGAFKDSVSINGVSIKDREIKK